MAFWKKKKQKPYRERVAEFWEWFPTVAADIASHFENDESDQVVTVPATPEPGPAPKIVTAVEAADGSGAQVPETIPPDSFDLLISDMFANTKLLANVRPSASATATDSSPSGFSSIAPWNRRSASSRSITSRN